MATVLVTGGSGFIGSHAIVQLLAAGYDVRTTVRDLQRADEVRAMVRRGGAEADGRLRFFAADLLKDEGWRDATEGCAFVLHVASPFPAGVPKHEDDLIVPAREGTLRVLRAAQYARVKRVVLTSSFAAIGYGHPPREEPFTEKDWTNPDAKGVGAYAKSKTLAEKAAWRFIELEGGGLELAVVNPVAVFGPVLSADTSTSILVVKKMLDGSMPGVPKLWFGAVDVRDVADLHLRAMTDARAKGHRFLAVAEDFLSVKDIALILKGRLGEDAKKVPTREIPDWVLRAAALFDPAVKLVLPELGNRKNASNEKARLLGWTPRSNEEAIVATAESLLRL